MSYRLENDYFTPPTKGALLKALLPGWNGSKTDLRQMSIKRLRGIFKTERLRVERELMGR